MSVEAKVRTNLGIEPAVLVEIYRQMSRIRAVDKAIQAGLSSGRLRFNYWPSTGQEGIPAVISQLTTQRDYMVTTYRGIHDQVAKGVPLDRLFAEALSRIDGVNKGKGGAPHISDPASGSMLTTAIVGAGAPIANGLAMAAQLRGEDRVTVVNFGDGATSIGAVHEAMNLAGVWKLPVVFLCQNNQIGEYTKIAGYTASKDFAGRAAGYGFTGVKLDGNDPIAFYNGLKPVIEAVRRGEGPAFVEAVTLRLGRHAGVGDSPELTREELKAGKAAAPGVTTRKLLIETGICGEEDLAKIDAAAAAEVEAAIEWALGCKVTPVEETLVDVYGDIEVIPRRGHYPARAAEAAAAASGEDRQVLTCEAITEAQAIALELDPGVVLLGEDVGDPPGGVFKTSVGLQTKFGPRVRPTPIAEQSIIGAGTGAALVGMRPICEIMFSDFTAVCLDQIVNHAAKQRYMSGAATHVPMTIRMTTGAGLGGFGAQHSQSLEAWLLHTPGLKVAYPSNPLDAKGLLLSCIFDDDPCVMLESITLLRGHRGPLPAGDYRIPLGVAKVVRPGRDISLITYGWEVHQCLAAAEELAKEGIEAEVIDLRSLMPLDYHRVLDSVRKTRRALVVHAATEFCGLGSEIASTLNEELFSSLKAPASRLGAEYAPIAYSPEIEFNQIPYAPAITRRVRELIAFK
ncbi:MAG TPA: dehydrogenase E1 component subunit alpha/beta [Phenylobacterium sp.]|uniref:alpha-ketoacid dehydrogenase subunit alpha/beta n=1 Tax=Phenylobacterium sp. TaxID=1871053 RepID=UPI002B47AF5E|nr:dehydrogenase E1 component subunit alpha/beta [Phenylobacterium sp.]HKR88359.1 dehydrogenase E1 component subunit alpha/beta [Phenylobacterium sp.]